MTKQSLAGLTQELLDLREAIDDAEGAEEMDALLQSAMGETQEDLERKVEGYCRIIREFEMEADARKREAERFRLMAQASESRAKNIKAWLQKNLDLLGMSKVSAGPFRVSVQNNGGPMPVDLLEENPESLPDEFVERVPKVNLKAIRAALSSGVDLAFARLGERGRHVRIK